MFKLKLIIIHIESDIGNVFQLEGMLGCKKNFSNILMMISDSDLLLNPDDLSSFFSHTYYVQIETHHYSY